MKTKIKHSIILAVTVLLFCAGVNTVYATEEIKRVRLSFSSPEELETGVPIGEITVVTESSGYFVQDAYFMSKEMTWERGMIPKVKVELCAKDGYRFGGTGKSKFSLSGMNARYSSASIKEGGQYLELTVLLNRIGGAFNAVEDLWWDGVRAEWEAVEGAPEYEVVLYLNGSWLESVKTTQNYYNFSYQMTTPGKYQFRVRAVSPNGKDKGEWIERSLINEVLADGTLSEPSTTPVQVSDGKEGWIQDKIGWWYRYWDGNYPRDSWQQFGGKWYYFNTGGYMHTGWVQWNEIWYYNLPDGAMATGWNNINEEWYYFSQNGELLSSTTTPDGFRVDASGIWLN